MTTLPNCFACTHATILTLPDGRLDFSQKMCIANPPTPLLLPAGPNQIAIKAFWPVVTKEMVCHTFALSDNAIEEATEGAKPQ